MNTRVSHSTVVVYDFIVKFMIENIHAPSIRQISQATGLKSTSSVHLQLKKLETLGMITTEGDAHFRSIKLNGYKLVKDETKPLPDLNDLFTNEEI